MTVFYYEYRALISVRRFYYPSDDLHFSIVYWKYVTLLCNNHTILMHNNVMFNNYSKKTRPIKIVEFKIAQLSLQ